MASGGDDYQPKDPERDLFVHVLQKGLQLGAVLGVAVGAPVTAWRTRSLAPERMLRAAGYGTFAGLGVGLALYAAKRRTMDAEGVADRAYRLHFNAGQNRTDAFAAVGAAAGLAATALLVRPPFIGLVGGAAYGAAVGIAAHVLTTPAKEEAKAAPSIMMNELKTN